MAVPVSWRRARPLVVPVGAFHAGPASGPSRPPPREARGRRPGAGLVERRREVGAPRRVVADRRLRGDVRRPRRLARGVRRQASTDRRSRTDRVPRRPGHPPRLRRPLDVYAGLYSKLLRGYALDAIERPGRSRAEGVHREPAPPDWSARPVLRPLSSASARSGGSNPVGSSAPSSSSVTSPVALSVFPRAAA